MRSLLVVLSAVFTQSLIAQSTITGSISYDTSYSISPLIYGYNQDHENINGDENFQSRRLGGNRLTVFNWENGASNSGHDNTSYPNDNRIPSLVGVPWNDKDKAGEAYRFFHQENLNANVTSIITLPILGWVAADKNGSNLTSPPSSRWDELVHKKNAAFTLTPDLNDGKVYLDESVNFLVQTFGDASTANGVKYYSLDNEPALWDATHDLLQPTAPACKDYVDKVISAALAVKSVDPLAKIIVGEFAGINLYDFGSAPDWGTEGNGYDWFPSYFLDKLKQASDTSGVQLVDLIAIHNYPQHKIDASGNFSGSGIVVRTSNSTADNIRSARMDFPRSLWDSTYIEPSWLTGSKLSNEANKVFLRLQNSIKQYYPGVKIMIGEYDYGFDTDFSHGIAVVELLTASAANDLEIINRWDLNVGNSNTYTSSAYQLMGNYDGSNTGYGNRAFATNFDNHDRGSFWASYDSDDNDLHLVLINKHLSDSTDFSLDLNSNKFTHTFKEMRQLNSNSDALVTPSFNGTINNQQFDIKLPASSATHIVLERNSVVTNVVQKEKKTTITYSPATHQLQGLAGQWQISDTSGKVISSGKSSTFDLPKLNSGCYIVTDSHSSLKFVVR